MRIFDRIVMTTIAVALVAIALNMWSQVPVVRADGPVDVKIVGVSSYMLGELPVSIADSVNVRVQGGAVEIDGGTVTIQEPISVQGSVYCYQ